MAGDLDLTVVIKDRNGMRFGTWQIDSKEGTVPTQAITSRNLEQAILADEPDFDFGTKILQITEMEPERLNNKTYRQERVNIIRQSIKDNSDMLCLLAVRGIRSNFRINKAVNEMLIQFQIDCGFKLIQVFFNYVTDAINDLRDFRNAIESKKKIFVACLDEKLDSNLFKSLYLECIERHDDIVSFYGRRPNKKNARNFGLIFSRKNDNVIRLSSFISKNNNNMINSVARHLLGFDCFSFLERVPSETEFGYGLMALDKFYLNTLRKDTPLTCALTGENLYTSSQKFKKNQESEYLPIYIHDIVRLNELFETLHKKYTYKELSKLFVGRML